MKYPLFKLLDLTELQKLMEGFHRATGINHALLDLDGTILTEVGWQTVCRQFHHAHPETCERCLIKKPVLWKRLANQPYVGHRCRNGLFDYATSVVIDGEHVANMFTGQILHQPPNLDRFRKQAEAFGYDEKPYIEAIGQVTIIPRERMPDIMAFLVSLAQVLGTNGLVRQRQLEAEDNLQLLNAELSLRVEERIAELSEKNRLLLQKDRSLLQSRDLLMKLSDQVPGVLFQYRVFPNGKACFPFANQAMQEIYEVSPEQVRIDASVVTAFHHPEDAKEISASLKQSARRLQPWHCEYRVILPKQGLRWRLGHAHPEKLEDGSILWHGFITDITERKQLQDELERQAHLDYLTGLANRRYFMEQAQRELARALRYGASLSVLMLDIDHFKQINDTYGHRIGDIVLQAFSEVCKTSLRQGDVIGRLGGEEFAVLLPETDAREAQELAERLRELMGRVALPLAPGRPLNFTISIGVAPLPSKKINLDTLLNQADQAMYEAKRSGRNKVCLYRDES